MVPKRNHQLSSPNLNVKVNGKSKRNPYGADPGVELMTMSSKIFWSFLIQVLIATQFAFAGFGGKDAIPDCPDERGNALPINNKQALSWKYGPDQRPNQFRARARLRGYVELSYPDRNGHRHFVIQIGPDEARDTVEVIYNEDFGPIPDLSKGMRVEACGDFIISTEQSGEYPPSPVGAIIHWVHMNPSHRGHPPGYLWIEGKLCGQEPDRKSSQFFEPALAY